MTAELTPITAISAVCTLAQVKAALNITDSADDARLTTIIEAVDALMRSQWDIPEVPVSTETRVFFPDGRLVYTDNAVTITAITDADSNAFTYETVAGRESGDPIRWVTLDYEHSGPVSVTGTWGLATMPADITRAAVECCRVWYKRERGGGEVDNSYIGNLSGIPQVTRDIMAARRTWRF